MEEPPTNAVPLSELIRYVFRYAAYALEDSLYEFKEDVMKNQGWTEKEAKQGYEMLQRLIKSIEAQAHVVEGLENTPE